MGEDAKICEAGGGGLLLPLIEDEQTWNKTGRAFIYFVALLWCFLGVSIVADIFMAAIEAVTSKRKEKKLSNGRTVAVKVWNETVANLTLMALGSSAPEILLSIIELFSAEMYAGDLGPSTIVGSAAFNLLCIIAVCVYVIPDGEKRTIKQPVVFMITSAFSVFAYLWLIIILAVATPDLVTPVEGVLSFTFFPILVVMAYLADIGVIGPKAQAETNQKMDDLRAYMLEQGEEISEQDLKWMSHMHGKDESKSRAHHRLKVTKGTTAGKAQAPEKVVDERDLAVGFMSPVCYFLDGAACVSLDVEKTGFAAYSARVEIDFVIYDRSSNVVKMDKLHLMPGQLSGALMATVPPRLERQDGDKNQEEGKFFWVDLIRATYHKDDGVKRVSVLDHVCAEAMARMKDRSKVTIPKDCSRAKAYLHASQTGAGQLRVEMSEVTHKPCKDKQSTVRIEVQRFNGSDGEIKCRYRTEAATARADLDFFAAEGTLTFPDKTMHKWVDVKIAERGACEGADKFYVILSDVDDDSHVVVPDASTCVVSIAAISKSPKVGATIMRRIDTAVNLDAVAEGNHQYKEQFVMALRPVHGDESDAAEATAVDWTIHFIALPWKLLFAFIPPATYCGGWLCFAVALVFIGGVTAVIGDLAALMGCCLDLPDAITAITIVALGTSLPDTFASKVAAVEEPTADAAIGNVTGSNSVNVFLGLGLPWMISSIYWAVNGVNDEWKAKYPSLVAVYPEGGFAVIAGDLVFSVVIFTMCSCIALGVIFYRRYAFQAELGGPRGAKVNTSIFFVMLWVFYVGVASWKVVNPGVGVSSQVVAVLVGIMGVGVGMVVISGIINLVSWTRASQRTAAKDHIGHALMEHALMQHAARASGMHATAAKDHIGHALLEHALMEHAARANSFQQVAAASAALGSQGGGGSGNSGGSLGKAVVDLRQHLNGLDQVVRSLEAALAAQQNIYADSSPGSRRGVELKATE